MILFKIVITIIIIIITIITIEVNSVSININDIDNINLDKNKFLRFDKNNKFKIIQFTDLHFGEGENESWGNEQDDNSTRVMNTIIDKEVNVDLIVFTGDLITGNNINGNASLYWEKAISIAKNRNIPWVIAFGNHDDLSSGLNNSRFDLMSLDIGLGSHSKFGPVEVPGVSNFVLEIYDHSNKNIISLIWIFDSGDSENDCKNKPSSGDDNNRSFGNGYICNSYITKEQIKWYEDLSNSYNGSNVLWESAFFHIPLQEYMNLWNYDICYGFNNDSIACQPKNEGLMNKFIELGNIKLISVGHNHGNDFLVNKNNIDICFGRHTGYGGYGTWERGARVIELTYDFNNNQITHSTHITFETGDIVYNQPIHNPNNNNNTKPQTQCTS